MDSKKCMYLVIDSKTVLKYIFTTKLLIPSTMNKIYFMQRTLIQYIIIQKMCCSSTAGKGNKTKDWGLVQNAALIIEIWLV